MVDLLDQTREQMLEIFPGLTDVWDRDNGVTFLETFFNLYCAKAELLQKWKEVKFENAPVSPFIALDIEILKIRMVPNRLNHRPYFTEEQEDFLADLDEETYLKPVFLDREEYLRTMEVLMNHTIPEDENARLMQGWVNCIYELKHLGVSHENRFNISKRHKSRGRTFRYYHRGWHGLRHLFGRKPR